jgi:hypothetical protein
MLTFDEAAHRYYYDGREVHGVTSVLKLLGEYEGVPMSMLEYASERGRAVHKATELLDQDDLDWGSLSDELIPYVAAWDKFKSESKVEILKAEWQIYHPVYGYAGMPDREVIIKKKRGVLDIKTSAQLMPSVGPQTAAYLNGGNVGREKTELMKYRWACHLRNDGTYRLHPLIDTTDWPTFLSCLSITNWRKNHD